METTNVNTGWEGGVIKHVEIKLGKKLVWLICQLHTNELPLRHLITNLDGEMKSNNKWSGVIGSMLDLATDLDINPSFETIKIGNPAISLDYIIINDLSADQFYGYKVVCAIRSGILPPKLHLLQIGPVSHSRWLTTANRICRIWISNHDIQGKDLENLRSISEFILGVYFPCWFKIKVEHSWIEGPKYVLYQLQQLKFQKEDVVKIVLSSIQRSAWFCFSECIIQTLLCSSTEEDRSVAVKKIKDIRGTGNEDLQEGDSSPRPRKTPILNFNAEKLVDPISWESPVYEPVLTTTLTTFEINEFLSKPMLVPNWPCHGQSVERCVKQVTEASSRVHTHEKRDGFVRSQEASRKFMSKNNSKQDLESLTEILL